MSNNLSKEDKELEDFMYYSALFNLYRSNLTISEQNALENYFGSGLEQSEIAENEQVSRQSIHKTINVAKSKLYELEQQIGFYSFNFIAKTQIDKALNFLSANKTQETIKILKDLKKEL